MMLRRALVALVLSALLAPSMAWAQSEEDAQKQLARVYFEARKLIRKNKIPEAISKLEEGLAIGSPNESLLFDLAKLAGESKQCDRAILYLTGFLYLAPGDPDAKGLDAKRQRCIKSFKSIATINIESTHPKSVEVRMNNVVVGRTPVYSLKLPPGEYTLTAKDELYLPYSETIHLDAGVELRERFAMKKKRFKGSLEVKVDPADKDVSVYLNEVNMGSAPFKREGLVTQRYLVRIEKPGWDRWIRYVTIERDETTVVDARLEKTGTMVPIPPIPHDDGN